VHRGQVTLVAEAGTSLPTSSSFAEWGANGVVSELCWTAAAIAAFRTWLNGGFMPQVRHAGMGEFEVAVLASKLDGTGFEKEHIGQTHVPVDCLSEYGAGRGVNGLLERETGDDEDERYARGGAFGVVDAIRSDPRPFLDGLAYSVTFGDDLRNPAWKN
jgi:hypothetical protein